MSKMIQLRNVPDELHRKLKARAALEGMSLSDYLLGEIQRVAERPTLVELRERLRQRSAVSPSETPAEAVRAEQALAAGGQSLPPQSDGQKSVICPVVGLCAGS